MGWNVLRMRAMDVCGGQERERNGDRSGDCGSVLFFLLGLHGFSDAGDLGQICCEFLLKIGRENCADVIFVLMGKSLLLR